MADYTITVADVRDGGAFQTSASDDEVTSVIEVVSTVDACLDGAGVSDVMGKLQKKFAARHMLTLAANSGSGAVASRSTPIGASISFATWQGVSLGATPFGQMLQGLDRSGCFSGLFEFGQPVALWSAG